MSVVLPEGEFVSYLSLNGIKTARITDVAVRGSNVYYRMENGDYITDTLQGLVMTGRKAPYFPPTCAENRLY